MPHEFSYYVFLRHSAKDKRSKPPALMHDTGGNAFMRDVAERLKKDGLRVWLDECDIRPGDRMAAKIEKRSKPPTSLDDLVDELKNDISRFAFEKYPQADPALTTQMRSVGEAMTIGRAFKATLQKCLRSLEIGHNRLDGDGKSRRIGTEVYGGLDVLPRDVIGRKLSVPNAERIFFIRHALRAGFTIKETFNRTKIDRWFLVQTKEFVEFDEELAGGKN